MAPLRHLSAKLLSDRMRSRPRHTADAALDRRRGDRI